MAGSSIFSVNFTKSKKTSHNYKSVLTSLFCDSQRLLSSHPVMPGFYNICFYCACHATLWTENSNEHPKTRDQQKYDIEIPQSRLVWSGSRHVKISWNFSILWNLLRIYNCRPFSVLKTLTGSRREKIFKCHKTWFPPLSPAQTKH